MKKFLLSISFVLTAAVMPAIADDLTPPTWRGSAGTTFQHWDFSNGPGAAAPDGLPPWNNPNGTPMLTVTQPTNWLPSFNGRNDVWMVNGSSILTFDIPNFNVPTHQKELVLQVTYWAPAPATGLAYNVMSFSSANFTQVGSSVFTTLAGGWIHELSVWSLASCPPGEHVQILPPFPGVTAFVDQVVIDTRCFVPTPGAIALFGIGGFMSAVDVKSI